MNKTINKLIKDIKSLRIQGAHAVVKAVLQGMKYHSRVIPRPRDLDKKKWLKEFYQVADKLAFARPTEPSAQNALKLVRQQLELADRAGSENFVGVVNDTLNFYEELIDSNRAKIKNIGYKLVKNNQNILTHCHSSTVESILITAKQKGKKFQVFADETRPLFQGRITARNLAKAKIKVTQIPDSASGFLISEYSGKDLMIDQIFIGADAILPNGSVLNKIGSYDIAASAYLNKVPLYIFGNLLKYDTDGIIEIETRSDKEVWPKVPKGVKILNFAFDVVPPKFITGIVTEFGIIKPKDVKKIIKNNYSWMQV